MHATDHGQGDGRTVNVREAQDARDAQATPPARWLHDASGPAVSGTTVLAKLGVEAHTQHALARSCSRLAPDMVGPRPATITHRLAASLPLLPAVDELGRRRVDVIGVRGAQEVPAALNDAEFGMGAVEEELRLILGIRD
jgi:hypothetical protein